ncbi:MAG: tetraacyldisaccharide 4'-kinase [Agriterribacter sp.]
MSFKSVWLKLIRVLLFPVAIVYGAVVKLRNFLYDKEIIKSTNFNFPVINVGNLSVGGTGKSPMVEYLIALLVPTYKVATLSRGYKRKTRGYILARENTTAIDLGDEPMQFHLKFPEVAVAAGEERAIAIPQILFDKPETDVIILDDAFQHRAVTAGFNILLTDFNHLFYKDFFLPTGNLRDSRSRYKKADVIVVTKCSDAITKEDKKKISNRINPLPHQLVFFTKINYGTAYHIITKEKIKLNKQTAILLVCGIANPVSLKKYIAERVASVEGIYYRDHYIFRIDDLKHITNRFNKMTGKHKIILTTEKDAVRLMKFEAVLKDTPLYILPIETSFLFDGMQQFNVAVKRFINDFKEKY